jgi:hypothetical protein
MQNRFMTDDLGQRGESLFSALITKMWGRQRPVFRSKFLGDKWPALDFIVELIGAGDITPYFFAQIKTTRRGYTEKGRLRVNVSSRELRKIASYPASTYIIGIDDAGEIGYIVSANGDWMGGVSSLTTEHPINETNQNLLWQEVLRFWTEAKLPRATSVFKDPQWKVKL